MKPTLQAPGFKAVETEVCLIAFKLWFKFSSCAATTSTASFFCLPKEDYVQLLKLYPLEEDLITRNSLIAFDDFSLAAGAYTRSR
jgi:hypothetical protein